MQEYPRVEVRTRGEWRAWLQKNHAQPGSIWLVTFKKSSGEAHLPYSEVVDEALCFGWIDSRPARLDEKRSMLLLSPRRRGSAWSKVNKDRVERLVADGLMTPAGLEKVEQARVDGTWMFLDQVDAMVMPVDLIGAFDAAIPEARAFWDGFNRSSRRGILEWIHQAKRPETRAKRIAETVEMAGRGLRANFPADRA